MSWRAWASSYFHSFCTMPVTPPSSNRPKHVHAKSSNAQDFIDHLIKEDIISAQEAKDAINESNRLGRSIEAILIDRQSLTEEEMLSEKGAFLDIPWRAISSEYKIAESGISQIPEEAVKIEGGALPATRAARTVEAILEEEAPIVKMVSVIMRHASEGGASDIHIEPLGYRLRVRFRMDGILHTSILLPIAVHPAIVSRIKILDR